MVTSHPVARMTKNGNYTVLNHHSKGSCIFRLAFLKERSFYGSADKSQHATCVKAFSLLFGGLAEKSEPRQHENAQGQANPQPSTPPFPFKIVADRLTKHPALQISLAPLQNLMTKKVAVSRFCLDSKKKGPALKTWRTTEKKKNKHKQ